MAENVTKSEYLTIAFAVADLPQGCDATNVGPAGIPLATTMFGLLPADFNPLHPGRYDGMGRYGHVFEVQVKRGNAQTLAGRNHPAVLDVFE